MADIVFTGETPSAVIGQDEMPNNVDIKIYKGDYYEWFISLQDSLGNGVDISQDTPKAQLRETYEASNAVELDCQVDVDGDIRVYLSSAVSSTLDPTKDYIWDLQTTNYRGDTKTWVTGDVDVQNEVTR
jgi:hypothetical protein